MSLGRGPPPARVATGRELRERHRVDEDLVVGQAADREVRTGVRLRRGQKGRVERQRAQQVDPTARDPLPQPLEVRIRPDAPIVRRADGVHGHEGTEAPGAGRTGRCGEEQGRLGCPRTFERQVMPAGRDRPSRDRRQVERNPHPRPAGSAGARRAVATQRGGEEARLTSPSSSSRLSQTSSYATEAGSVATTADGRSIHCTSTGSSWRRFVASCCSRRTLPARSGDESGTPSAWRRATTTSVSASWVPAFDVLIARRYAVVAGERSQVRFQASRVGLRGWRGSRAPECRPTSAGCSSRSSVRRAPSPGGRSRATRRPGSGSKEGTRLWRATSR